MVESYCNNMNGGIMEKLTYIQCLNNTLITYGEKGSKAAYAYIKENMDKVSDGNKAQLFNFKYCLAAASGQHDDALKFLEEAVMDRGYWYSAEYLENEDDLEKLRKQPKFKEIVKVCRERESAAKAAATATMVLEDRTNPCAIMVVHGDQENAAMTGSYWSSVKGRTAGSGAYDLALPQSSQIQFHDAYGWDDLALGLEEMKRHMTDLSQAGYSGIVLGGFSAGGRMIVESLLEENFEGIWTGNADKVSRGIILLAPWLPEEDQWVPVVKNLAGKGFKFYILAGEEDVDCYECAELFAKNLEAAGIDHVFERVPGLGHDYPTDFADRLEKALAWIEG